jgi:molecular chaperone GrpE
MNFDDNQRENTEDTDHFLEVIEEPKPAVSEPTAPQEMEPTIESLQADLSNMKDQWLRAVAEGENIRRRALREIEDSNKFAVTSLARNLLNVADNLSRALESTQALKDLPEGVQALIDGIQLTQNELMSLFDKHQIVCISPLNEKFDPSLHQAMFEMEDNTVEAGTVVQVLQAGYVLHDRLLRPALVAVSKRSS